MSAGASSDEVRSGQVSPDYYLAGRVSRAFISFALSALHSHSGLSARRSHSRSRSRSRRPAPAQAGPFALPASLHSDPPPAPYRQLTFA